MSQNYVSKNPNLLNPNTYTSLQAGRATPKKMHYKFNSLISFLSLFVLLLFGSNVHGQSPSIYTSSGTWTCPAGVTSVTVEAWGGGGSGKTSSSTKGYAGGGGGGGAYSIRNTVAVTAGTTYTITVGSGGTANNTGTNTSGGASTATFGSTTITAAGGAVGGALSYNSPGGSGGLASSSIGDVTFNGGNGGNSKGSSGGSGAGGGGGGGAGTTAAGSTGSTPTTNSTGGTGGAQVSLYGGAGGKGGDDNNPGTTASTVGYGGGGGGAGNGNGSFGWIGGNGQNGAIIITFTCPNNNTNAGSNQTLAACATTTTLAANTATYGSGTWSLVSGTATISNPSSPTSGVTGLALGATATLRWTITNAACGSTFSNMTITTVRGVGCISYCIPSVSNGYQATNYINEVNFIGNIINSNNTSTYSASPLGYQDRSTLGSRATQAQGEGVNIYTNTTGGANYMKAWVDWDNNGIFDESTEVVYQCTNAFINTTFGFKIPETTTPGNYRIRIRINKSNSASDNTFGACNNIANYGETEDYLFTVISNCAAKITSISSGFNCGNGSVTLAAVGTAGTTEYRWYTTLTGGSYVSSTSSTWATPSITSTTTYYVTAFNGTCESLFRTAVLATIKPVPTLTFANANPTVCGENSIIDLQAASSFEQIFLIDENFENGLGTFTNTSIASPDVTKTNWQIQSSTYVPPYPTFPVWYPAISSGFGTNKFAMTTSDVVAGGLTFGKVETALVSATVNTTGFLNLSLSFKMYFSSYLDSNSATAEFVNVEVSTNGGTSWISTPIVQYLNDVGIGTQFVTPPDFNMSAYIGYTALKIRIRYKAGWNDGVAVDDIKLFGNKPLAPSFQWTSALPIDAYTDAACTSSYTAGTPATIVYVKPTLAQLEQNLYSFTAKANLANGCSTSAVINVTNTTKVWKGTTDNDWNKASNWLPAAVPTSSTCVIIPTGTTSKILNTPNALAKTLTVKAPTGNLELQSDKDLTVTDKITVETGATFNIRNNASLVQINNVSNTGIVNVERTTPGIRQLDYTYWSSPVSGFSLGSYSTSNSYMYSWIPTISNGGGNWKPESDASIMGVGKGYIIRTPWGHTDGATYTAKFTGPPNNGDVLTPISKGTNANMVPGTVDDEDDEWNLIGNPYPSGLNIAKLIDLPANLNVIDGTVYIWTHNTLPSTAAPDPFYGDYVLNYTAEDYATVNKTGATVTAGAASTGTRVPTAYIAAGQSFFIKSANTMPNGTTANVTFNNAMRETGQNNNFFKQVSTTKNESIPRSIPDLEKHRIWLNLTNNADAFSQILIGYIEGATKGLDRGFDGESLGGNDVTFYSVIPEAKLTIQGRNLPFDENDQIALGYNAAVEGTYSIRIDHTDGLLDNQKIYLIDQLTQKTHDLRAKPYEFDSEEGDFNDRFILRFNSTAKTLGTETFELSNTVTVIVKENVTVKSTSETIKTIEVFDLLGKKIDSYKKVNASQYTLNHLNKTTAGLIVKITLENDAVISKKIIY